MAGLRVEPRGDIERQYRGFAGACPLDQRGVGRFDRARDAHAKESVHHQRRTLRGQVRAERAALGHECAIRGGRVGGQVLRIRRHHDDDLVVLAAQDARDDERVAAVVAGTGENRDRAAAIGQQVARVRGGGGAGAFHQRKIGVGCLDLAQRDDIDDGLEDGIHRFDYRGWTGVDSDALPRPSCA